MLTLRADKGNSPEFTTSMAKTSRPPLVKEALKEMENAEDQVRKYLRRASILLGSAHTEARMNHLLNTPKIERTKNHCGHCKGCKAPTCKACKACLGKQACTDGTRICQSWIKSPTTSAATPSSASSTRSNSGLQATGKALAEGLDCYMGKSGKLRHVIKEVGWDDDSWPELHDVHLKEAREKLGHEVKEALINLNEKTDVQDRWNDFD